MEYSVPPDLAAIRWKKSAKYLMAPPYHPLTKFKKVTIRRIVEYPLILPTNDYPIRKRFEEKLEQFNLKCHIAIELPNVLLCADCVELGLGISFIAGGLYKQFLKEKRKIVFIPLRNLFDLDYKVIVIRKDKKLLDYQKEFINIFLGEAIL
jgi:LysR family cys regulon transcriptional activator